MIVCNSFRSYLIYEVDFMGPPLQNRFQAKKCLYKSGDSALLHTDLLI